MRSDVKIHQTSELRSILDQTIEIRTGHLCSPFLRQGTSKTAGRALILTATMT